MMDDPNVFTLVVWAFRAASVIVFLWAMYGIWCALKGIFSDPIVDDEEDEV